MDGALPGIVKEAFPRSGDRYRQEFQEGVAEDQALVMRLNAGFDIGLGSFADCLETKEWSPLDHGAIEHKSYVAGTGLVLVEELKVRALEELVAILRE